jgi:hypothetical protein
MNINQYFVLADLNNLWSLVMKEIILIINLVNYFIL